MANPLYNRVWFKFKHDNNFVGGVVGATGSGKSWAALRLAYDLDIDEDGNHRFPMDASRIVFNVKDFYKIIEQRVDGLIPPGSFVILDEAAIDLSASKDYRDESIVNMQEILQTFRLYRLGVIMTFPGSLGFLNRKVRMMFDAIFDMRDMNYQEKYSVAVPHWIQVNSYSSKDYRHSPKGVDEYGEDTVMAALHIHAPPQELVEAYAVKKLEFSRKLLKEKILFEEEKVTAEKKRLSFSEIVRIVRRRRDDFVSNNHLDYTKVMLEFDLGERNSRAVVKLVNAGG